MRVSVAGLWHLGVVTAACCAAAEHSVIAFDEENTVFALRQDHLPVEEPGVLDLLVAASQSSKLSYTADVHEAGKCDVLWICYDTPVDENDVADTEFVMSRVKQLVNSLEPDALVLISSQLPVGSTAKLERLYPGRSFAYSPENLRLGKAVEVFTKPERVVAGVRRAQDREKLSELFRPFTQNIEWMSVESAEMTKHALNAFLATSVAFINEVATLCERTGADAQEVERGLKSDLRIGKRAYLHPGSAFAGGTLARDLIFLVGVGKEQSVPTNLLQGVLSSNSVHRLWAQRRLTSLLGDVFGKTLAILGLTYKPGTNTLRRSTSIEICHWLLEQGATVQAFDPAIQQLPEELRAIHLSTRAEGALEGAEAVLLLTPWPEFLSLRPDTFASAMKRALVLDPSRYLENTLKDVRAVEYHGIGISR